jgi:hypothetical protein
VTDVPGRSLDARDRGHNKPVIARGSAGTCRLHRSGWAASGMTVTISATRSSVAGPSAWIPEQGREAGSRSDRMRHPIRPWLIWHLDDCFKVDERDVVVRQSVNRKVVHGLGRDGDIWARRTEPKLDIHRIGGFDNYK